MVLSDIQIPIQWCQPSLQRSHNIFHFSTPKRKLNYKWTFMTLFAFSLATNVSSLPGTNYALIQGIYYNSSFCQRQYVNTPIWNNTDRIAAFENIYNPFTTDNVYPDANLHRTPSVFTYYTVSTSYVIDTGANSIILNYVRQFKFFHSCNSNVKGNGGSDISIRWTGITYIPIESDDVTVDRIKVPDTVFVPSSPFNLLPSQIFIPDLQNAGHVTY